MANKFAMKLIANHFTCLEIKITVAALELNSMPEPN